MAITLNSFSSVKLSSENDQCSVYWEFIWVWICLHFFLLLHLLGTTCAASSTQRPFQNRIECFFCSLLPRFVRYVLNGQFFLINCCEHFAQMNVHQFIHALRTNTRAHIDRKRRNQKEQLQHPFATSFASESLRWRRRPFICFCSSFRCSVMPAFTASDHIFLSLSLRTTEVCSRQTALNRRRDFTQTQTQIK